MQAGDDQHPCIPPHPKPQVVLFGFSKTGCDKSGVSETVWIGGIGFYEDLPATVGLSFNRSDCRRLAVSYSTCSPLIHNQSPRFKSFRLQVHWDNPSATTGLTDKSGVRLWLTSASVANEAGILQLGDGPVSMQGQTIPTGKV